jgi:antirestriction protein ArdC
MHADQQKIVDRIISELEAGTMPWRQQFKASRSKTGLPYNAVSGASYRGFNVVALLMTGKPIDGGWLTYKQAIACGGHVRKGERSTVIFYYKKLQKKKEKPADKDEFFLMAKSYLVFHLSQCDEIDPKKLHQFPAADAAPVDHKARNAEAENVAAATSANIEYTAKVSIPHYNLLADKVVMPLFEQYNSADAYYSTLFHELSHWTAKRLRRDIWNKFGSEKYAIEELVAELSACFILPQFGLNNEKNSASYFASWIKVLKESPAVLTRVASEAAKACAFINAFSSDASEPSEESEEAEISQAA